MAFWFLCLACLTVSIPITGMVVLSRLKWTHADVAEMAAAIQVNILMRLVGFACVAAAISAKVIQVTEVDLFGGLVITLVLSVLGGFVVRLPRL